MRKDYIVMINFVGRDRQGMEALLEPSLQCALAGGQKKAGDCRQPGGPLQNVVLAKYLQGQAAS
jgi:hypothetical protein